jgi:hypothetical protein
MLRSKYPDGFTYDQLAKDLGDNINGSIYVLNDSNDGNTPVLTLKTDDDKNIQIYLAKGDDNIYTLTGKFDATGVIPDAAGTESFLGKMVLALANVATEAKILDLRDSWVVMGKLKKSGKWSYLKQGDDTEEYENYVDSLYRPRMIKGKRTGGKADDYSIVLGCTRLGTNRGMTVLQEVQGIQKAWDDGNTKQRDVHVL